MLINVGMSLWLRFVLAPLVIHVILLLFSCEVFVSAGVVALFTCL